MSQGDEFQERGFLLLKGFVSKDEPGTYFYRLVQSIQPQSNPWRCWSVACWHAVFQSFDPTRHGECDERIRTVRTVVNLISLCPSKVRKHEKEDEGGRF